MRTFVLNFNRTVVLESYEGYSESIRCPYESQYQNNLKYMCRGNQRSTCRRQALITSHSRQHGRFRLDDDKISGKFTVTINSLTKSDSGSYLCGVQRNSDLDVFSAVELEVKGERSYCAEMPVTENELSILFLIGFYFSEAVHYAAYAVVPVVLLICVLIIIYKYKCYNVRGML
uniref:Immunoglobulin V-set domain-containing protein n=1 Tax=Pundamilia nyererei TaxID=303518 RepID=A0A3B4F847_9CICH